MGNCGSSKPAGAPREQSADTPLPPQASKNEAGVAGESATAAAATEEAENTQPGVKLETLQLGDKVQVKSVSKGKWFEGKVVSVDAAGAKVSYKAAQGRLTTKWIPVQKVKSLLRSTKPPQAVVAILNRRRSSSELDAMERSKSHSDSVELNGEPMANNFPSLEGNVKAADESSMPISGVPTPVPSPLNRDLVAVRDPRTLPVPSPSAGEGNPPPSPTPMTPPSVNLPDDINEQMDPQNNSFKVKGRQTPAPTKRVQPKFKNKSSKNAKQQQQLQLLTDMGSLTAPDSEDGVKEDEEAEQGFLTRQTSDGRVLKAYCAANGVDLTGSATDLVQDLEHEKTPTHRLNKAGEVHHQDKDSLSDDGDLSDRFASPGSRGPKRLNAAAAPGVAEEAGEPDDGETPPSLTPPEQLKAPFSGPRPFSPVPAGRPTSPGKTVDKQGFTLVQWDGVRKKSPHTGDADYKPPYAKIKSILTRREGKRKKKKKKKKKRKNARSDDEDSEADAEPQRSVTWNNVIVAVPTVPREPKDKVPPSQRFYNQMCEIFATLDKDQDGRLNLMEMKNFCQHVYNDCTDDDVITLCLQFSKTPTQGLDFQEWAHLVKATDPKLFSFADELYHKIVLGDYEDDTSSDDDDDSSDGGATPAPKPQPQRQNSGSSAGDSSDDEDQPRAKAGDDIEVSTTEEGSHGTPSSSVDDTAAPT